MITTTATTSNTQNVDRTQDISTLNSYQKPNIKTTRDTITSQTVGHHIIVSEAKLRLTVYGN